MNSVTGLNMTMELYQEVSLTRDLPEYGLRAGDVATLVDFVPHSSNGEEGCILEIFNAIGESLTEIVVPISAIELLDKQEDIYQGKLGELQQAASIGWEASQRGNVVDGNIAMEQIRSNLKSRYTK
jgi:hypothetical protein